MPGCGSLGAPPRAGGRRGRWGRRPLLCGHPVRQGTPDVSEERLPGLRAGVQHGFPSTVPMSSVYEFILQSLFSKKIHEVGGAQSGLGSSFTVPRMHVTTGRSQNQQGVCRRQRNRETQRVRETGVRAREREKLPCKRITIRSTSESL